MKRKAKKRVPKRSKRRAPRSRRRARRRNPARATLGDFNRAHLDSARELLCLIDGDCVDEKFDSYMLRYGGAAPWNIHNGLKLYVWTKDLKYSAGSFAEWIVVDPNSRKRAVGIGTLWKRTDGDGYDTGSAVIEAPYRRQGIYTGVLEALRKILGMPIWSDSSRTAGAEKVWKKFKKEKLAEYNQRHSRYRMMNPRRKMTR